MSISRSLDFARNAINESDSCNSRIGMTWIKASLERSMDPSRTHQQEGQPCPAHSIVDRRSRHAMAKWIVIKRDARKRLL
jgi:hypothetical protein